MRNEYKILFGKPDGKRYFGRSGRKRIIYLFQRARMRGWRPDSSGLGQGPIVSSCECGYELSGSAKGEELLG
jgi:hypothetical protein